MFIFIALSASKTALLFRKAVKFYFISKCFSVFFIASTIFGVGCALGFFNSSTALGASYIGNPKSRLTSAIYAVWTLKP